MALDEKMRNGNGKQKERKKSPETMTAENVKIRKRQETLKLGRITAGRQLMLTGVKLIVTSNYFYVCIRNHLLVTFENNNCFVAKLQTYYPLKLRNTGLLSLLL